MLSWGVVGKELFHIGTRQEPRRSSSGSAWQGLSRESRAGTLRGSSTAPAQPEPGPGSLQAVQLGQKDTGEAWEAQAGGRDGDRAAAGCLRVGWNRGPGTMDCGGWQCHHLRLVRARKGYWFSQSPDSAEKNLWENYLIFAYKAEGIDLTIWVLHCVLLLSVLEKSHGNHY